ncbi:MAG: glycoside hydrolase family 99-like domain-containing protein, partial [Candidatus Hydrogenedentes bacterium]|nr:glycoside hydrolase family 99-like domain-containing protein [Candidatus Hydrogenedentota bacterium]
MNTLLSLALILSAAPQVVQQWDFNTEADLAAWLPNTHLAEVSLREGALHARATDWDPFFVCDGIEIPARPWQVVVIRMRATKAGQGDFFWTADTSGPLGGLSEQRKVRFQGPGDGAWHDIALYPFWQRAGVIRKLRLDVYDGAEFDIDSIRIKDWDGGAEPATGTTWDRASLEFWQSFSEGRDLWSPPLSVDTEDLGWASVTVEATKDGVGALLWGTAARMGLHRQEFAIRAGTRTYNLELQGVLGWASLVALGLHMPQVGMRVTALELGESPSGPADVQMTYFGVENGVNRVGQPARVTAQFTNRGGMMVPRLTGRLTAPVALTVRPVETTATNLDFESRGVLTWTVEASEPGEYPVTLQLTGGDSPLTASATVVISAQPEVTPVDYVPVPQPVKTSVDVAAYYFPGWNSPAKWDPIQRVAPIRKPVLGWYDEANPEIVDWQIKWAVENGITVFLVDWYWIQGNQHLQHWLEAYKKSRYRDQLKIALMWANHNPAGTHSAEDWKRVSDHWITEYFPMDSYYQMNGKPAVFLWEHQNIRRDLGGTEAVRTAFSASQEAAKAAGFAGIHYVALHPRDQEGMLLKEGYHGITRYHEWGNALGL